MTAAAVTALKEERAQAIERMREIHEGAGGQDLAGEAEQEWQRLDTREQELGRIIGREERVLGLPSSQPGEREVRVENPEDDEWDGAMTEEEIREERARNRVVDLTEYRNRVFDPEQRARLRVPRTVTEYRALMQAPRVQDEAEYRWAFYHMLNCYRMHELDGREMRALSKATAAAGANLVPTEFERTLIDSLRVYGVMRDISRVITRSVGTTLQVPTVTSHGTAAWTAENAAFTESDEAFGQTSFAAYKAATIIKVSEELLTDSAFDLEAYLRTEFGNRIGILENTAYVVGDGSGKPTGVQTQATAGKVGTTGQTTSVTSDDLLDLYYSVSLPYRRQGTFLTNDGSVKAVRKIKDTTGQYIWSPGITAGEPDTLLGRPILADPDMPVMAANAKSILFGDFGQYWILDVNGIAFQRLDELYAANGQIGFRAYHRTEGKLVNTAAVKYYQNSAT